MPRQQKDILKTKQGVKKHSIMHVSDNEVLQKTGWNKR